MWLGYTIYFITKNEKLLTTRKTKPEKLFMLLKPGCLGNACQPQKFLNILSSEPWLLIKRLLTKKFVYHKKSRPTSSFSLDITISPHFLANIMYHQEV